MKPQAILSVRDLRIRYGKRIVVDGIGFDMNPGEVLLILGHNGAGKTTLLNGLFGLVPADGAVSFAGHPTAGRTPAENVASGMAFVPQGHGIFRRLTVADNLALGAYSLRDRSTLPERLARVRDLFPILSDRQSQLAGTLSGGQQQMLAIGIALMHAPRLLILDEPSIGLAPNLVQTVMNGVTRINRETGTSIVLVEQNIEASLPVASRVIVMKTGRMIYEGPPQRLHDKSYLMQLF